jgi:hypothetical protein
MNATLEKVTVFSQILRENKEYPASLIGIL